MSREGLVKGSSGTHNIGMAIDAGGETLAQQIVGVTP